MLFEENPEIRSQSQTGSKEYLLLILALTASKQWTWKLININAALLQGLELDQDIFLVPHSESNVAGILWVLEKCIYGLKDAAWMWYFAVWDKLEKAGYSNCLWILMRSCDVKSTALQVNSRSMQMIFSGLQVMNLKQLFF